ncbi:MAG: PBP1A family penicillin-binding protein [Pseudomonadota bacterium]
MAHPIVKGIISDVLSLLGGSIRLVKFLLSIVATVTLISIAIFVGIYLFFARGLPDIKSLADYHPPVVSRVLADDGTQIGEFWTECRIFMPFNDIPKRIVQAFIDSEDSRFYEHKGVDIRSIVRAFVANLRAGEVTQGGSTITQQITRSLLLTHEKSISRKAKEAILATRIERYLSKDQILTLYLNQIYLGNRAYGIAAAARNYFRKTPFELSLGQIALIAGLPTAPTNFSPVNNVTEARKCQQHVLGRMVEEGHISEEEARTAAAEQFDIYVSGIDKDFIEKDSAWFVEHVRRIVKEHYGDDVLYNEGFRIHTTENIPLQRAATAAVRRGIEGMDRRLGYRGPLEHIQPDKIPEHSKHIEKELLAKQRNLTIPWPPGSRESTAAIVFTPQETYKAIVTEFQGKDTIVQIGSNSGTIKLDGVKWARRWTPGSLGYDGASYVNNPKSILKVGDVILVRRLEDGSFALAQNPLIQSALFSMDPHTGFIKAMVGGYDFGKSEFNRVNQALRQPGSSFKPFVYASALDKGYTFNTTVVDGPVSFVVGRNDVWTPKNYGGGYSGAMSFKNCITFSKNIPTSKIVYDIGTHYLTAFERKMGITSPIGKYLSMALGANGVYLQEMVQAYSVFADNGVFKPAIAITRIENSRGRVVEQTSYPGGPAAAEEPKSEAGEEEKKAPEVKIGKDVSESDLNTGLWEEGRKAIEKDQLNLTDLEIKTLYGSVIPPHHAITPQTAFLVVNLLKNVVASGTAQRVKALGKPVAGKTGTTNDETDVWFIGFVPDLAAGVWVGFDEVQRIGPGVQGGNTAAPIFLDYMKTATEGWEAKDFQKPEGFPSGSIDDMTGGSSLFGSVPRKSLPGENTGGDRSGNFFDEDFESFH